jgi:hypothetical protein
MLEEIEQYNEMAEGLVGNINRIDQMLRSGEAYTDSNRVGLSLIYLNKQKIFKAKDSEDTCSVCLANTQTQEVCFELVCGHVFHKACIDPWFKQSHLCPNCRHDLAK